MWELFRYTLEIGTEGRFTTYRLDKWEHINFPFVIFPFLCSNIPVSSTYEVYFSTLKLFDSFTDGIMHCLIVNEYLCHRWPRIYFICGSQIPFLILELVLSVFFSIMASDCSVFSSYTKWQVLSLMWRTIKWKLFSQKRY